MEIKKKCILLLLSVLGFIFSGYALISENFGIFWGVDTIILVYAILMFSLFGIFNQFFYYFKGRKINFSLWVITGFVVSAIALSVHLIANFVINAYYFNPALVETSNKLNLNYTAPVLPIFSGEINGQLDSHPNIQILVKVKRSPSFKYKTYFHAKINTSTKFPYERKLIGDWHIVQHTNKITTQLLRKALNKEEVLTGIFHIVNVMILNSETNNKLDKASSFK